jgi:hypothetical protein
VVEQRAPDASVLRIGMHVEVIEQLFAQRREAGGLAVEVRYVDVVREDGTGDPLQDLFIGIELRQVRHRDPTPSVQCTRLSCSRPMKASTPIGSRSLSYSVADGDARTNILRR